jgi:hypothetical protein
MTKRAIAELVFILMACAAPPAVRNVPALAATPTPQAAAPATPEVRAADRAFLEALAKADKASVAKFLDEEFSWTRADGTFLSLAAVQRALPKPVLGRETDVQVTRHNYDQVEAIHVHSGKTYVLRVWVKRPDGWRLIVYHEVVQAAQAQPPGAAARGSGPTACENPCNSVPYKPQTDMDAAIIKGWQAQQTGEWHNNGEEWAYDIADEFMGINSNATRPATKATRSAALNRLREAGVQSGPVAPLISARLFDFGETAVMTALHKAGSDSFQCSRVWVHRDDHWQMAFSYQTRVEHPPNSSAPTRSAR